MAERDPRAVDLAEYRLITRNFRNERSFTKTHFPNPLTKLGVTTQGLHAAHPSGRELAERQVGRSGFGKVLRHEGNRRAIE